VGAFGSSQSVQTTTSTICCKQCAATASLFHCTLLLWLSPTEASQSHGFVIGFRCDGAWETTFWPANWNPPTRVCALNSGSWCLWGMYLANLPFLRQKYAFQMQHCRQWHASYGLLSHKLPLWHFSHVIRYHGDVSILWHGPYVAGIHAYRLTDTTCTNKLYTTVEGKRGMSFPSRSSQLRLQRALPGATFSTFTITVQDGRTIVIVRNYFVASWRSSKNKAGRYCSATVPLLTS